jgi:hypothetical protein
MFLALGLINEIQDRIGYPQSETLEVATLSSEERKILRLLNTVLKAWGGLKDWPLLRTDADFVLVADVVSDTTSGSEQYVTATQNDTTITVANMTAFDDTYISRAITVSGSSYVYRIVSVPAPNQLTLNRAWIDASITAADECTFTIGADRYVLPDDYDRATGDVKSFFAPYGISAVGPEEFRDIRRRSPEVSVGEPRYFTIYGMNDAETQELIHFHPFPDAARLLEYQYQRNHPEINSDNDKILVPQRYREALIEMVLQLAERDYEDDANSQVVLGDMLRAFNQQGSAQEITEDRKVMRPRNRMRTKIRNAYLRGGYHIDYGDYFDQHGHTGRY